MILSSFVGPSHWGASPLNIVQKPIENGHKVSGTTVTVYLILFLTITGVFFTGTEFVIILRYCTEHLIVTFCGQNWVMHFSFPFYLDNVLATAYSFLW